MAVDSLEKARAVLYAVLNVPAVTGIADVDAVFDHDPIVSAISGPAVVTMFAVGQDREFYQFVIRVYYDMLVARPEVAQKAIGGIIDAIDDAVVLDARVGPGVWTMEISSIGGRDALQAELDVSIGREDF